MKRQDPGMFGAAQPGASCTKTSFGRVPWPKKINISPLSSDVLPDVLEKGVPASEGSVTVQDRGCT